MSELFELTWEKAEPMRLDATVNAGPPEDRPGEQDLHLLELTAVGLTDDAISR